MVAKLHGFEMGVRSDDICSWSGTCSLRLAPSSRLRNLKTVGLNVANPFSTSRINLDNRSRTRRATQTTTCRKHIQSTWTLVKTKQWCGDLTKRCPRLGPKLDFVPCNCELGATSGPNLSHMFKQTIRHHAPTPRSQCSHFIRTTTGAYDLTFVPFCLQPMRIEFVVCANSVCVCDLDCGLESWPW